MELIEFYPTILNNFINLHLNSMKSHIQNSLTKKKRGGEILSTAQNVGNYTGIPQREARAVKAGPK